MGAESVRPKRARGVLKTAPMNAAAFGAKRAFHGFLRVTRKPLASVGLTAARFDMLYVLFSRAGADRCRPAIAQRELRAALGVCASVVSRMVRALERLGLLIRRRSLYDGRQIDLSLTLRGWARIHAARRWLLRGMQRIVLEAICFGRHTDPMECLEHMERLESYLSALRSHFFDRATLYYPWGHPDD
jgi:DNA-binding MarR family transcriptional regulator